MHQEDKILFSLLKKEIADTMMRSYPGLDPEISNWKGQEITDFQEDLLEKVNGQLSEKWFYNHMKTDSHSLPRVDVLNILSKYTGYKNWHDFRYKNAGKPAVADKPGRFINNLIRIPLLFLSVIILIFIIIKIINTQNYRFTFIDSDTREPVTDSNLRVELLNENESPLSIPASSGGSITVRTSKSSVTMIVKAPYYKTDTIKRVLRKIGHDEQVNLNADYYALMISYFSQSDVIGWENRRQKLTMIISDDAIIYMLPDKSAGSGIALYNKWEFIDKITMPSSGLRKIEILDCRYLDGKISVLRFRIKRNKE
ncbi:MAG: hypothetical protein A2X05_03640 [Bacteroidetes bacterium GWE2_41_25]|nr:MAG: hypothetical protein A2X03_06400 [Bacteroidetes bacterium GWA2_40_15]OFX91939.1 MAG: hypothetical protein A2X05_03640 [Bacteroidetes bacterium GWE2_41_25]OFX95660.1 MAG: hypothetical protein A2X06_02785 [Bacteroidetes bacterium GWC2_40_22]OFY58094.1 MAG: hypothetical protein A2X04_07525 [Bacteroidetes bacterium GWF2_41_9]HAM08939.1 hypothetical protein [Bacteroidales bacterium]